MKFEILAGDFPKGTTYKGGSDPSLLNPAKSVWRPEQIFLRGSIERIEIITEENKGKLLRTTGWGLVGYAALGPLGAFAGMLGIASKTMVCFVCYLLDGRKFMARADMKVYQELAAVAFTPTPSDRVALRPTPALQTPKAPAIPAAAPKAPAIPAAAPKAPAIPAAFCTQCGAARLQGANFCVSCGRGFASDRPAGDSE